MSAPATQTHQPAIMSSATMTPDALLLICAGRGMTLSLSPEDGSLHVAAPRGSLTDDLRAALRQHRNALIEALRRPSAVDVSTPVETQADAATVTTDAHSGTQGTGHSILANCAYRYGPDHLCHWVYNGTMGMRRYVCLACEPENTPPMAHGWQFRIDSGYGKAQQHDEEMAG